MNAGGLLSHAFLSAHPDDAAAVLEKLPVQEWIFLIGSVSASVAAAVIDRVAPAVGADCLEEMEPAVAGSLVKELRLDAAADLLRRIRPAHRDRILDEMGGEAAEPIRRLLTYPEQTAGALMDPHVISVPEDMNVGEALKQVRRYSRHARYYLYIVDRNQALVGVMNLRELMLAPTRQPLSAAMHHHVVRISAFADRRDIATHPGWRDYHALPVVDRNDRLIGVIRYVTLRQLEAAFSQARGGSAVLEIPLSLAGLYWTVLSGAMEGLVRSIDGPRDGSAGRDGRG